MKYLPSTSSFRAAMFTGVVFIFAHNYAPAQVRAGFTNVIIESSGKCIDVNGGDWSDGAAAIQYSCSGDANQQFTLQPFNGAYRLVVKHSAKCLVARAGSQAPNADIVQATCGAYPTQLWTPRRAGDAWQLASAAGLCIAVTGNSTADDARLSQVPCGQSRNQLFQFAAGLVVPGELTNIVAKHSGQCLMRSDSAPAQPLIQGVCNGRSLQQWQFIADQDGYKIAQGNSGLCATINGSNPAPGTNLVLAGCAAATRWFLRAENSYYMITAQAGARCLDVANASVSEGAAATQYSCSAGSANQRWILARATPVARWSGVIGVPLVPAAGANLKNGKILLWSAYDALRWDGDNRPAQTQTAIFDPATGTSASRLVTETWHDMFCPGTSMLADGRVLVNGGNSSEKTSIFNSDNNSWTQAAAMNIPRGYPGNATLSSGQVLTLGGSWSGPVGGKNGEVWSDTSGWTPRSGIPVGPFIGNDPGGVFRGDNQLWLFATAGNGAFHAGPSPEMHRITTGGAGSVASAGYRADDVYSMNGNALLYQQGKVLKVGGATAYEEAWANANAYVIEFDATTQYPRKISPMNYARAFHNSVLTPVGTIIITGGQTYARPFSDERATLIPEQWDPQTEIFSILPSMQRPRTYHSISILLPDGRVLAGGGGLCGACGTNHPDVEILTPSYLLNGDGSLAARPVISTANYQTTMTGSFAVTADAPIAYFSLLRLSSVTHSLNNDQRFIKVRAQTSNARNYTVQMPGSAGITIPGYYMLFGINTKGVPSVALTVSIR